ncbi:MAG: helix-turn-helix domain-containing protein [Minisyncoccia bacterium]
MTVNDAIKTLGFTDKQARVYLSLLELGESSAYPIARKSGLKTPTTYVILKELLELGVVHAVPRAKKKLFRPLDPKQLFAKAESRFVDAKAALPSILALVSSPSLAPVTRSFSGKTQLLNAYFDTLTKPDKMLRGWMSEGAWSEHGLGFFMNEYRPKRLKQNISNQFIVADTKVMREYAKDDETSRKEIRIDKNLNPQSDLFLYDGNKVIIASFYEEMGVIIESEHIHALLEQIFTAHWKSLV